MKDYENPSLSPETRARDLLGRMSTEEKMAQLTCVFPGGADDFEKLRQDAALGIGEVSCLEMRMLETPEECAAFQRNYQQFIIDHSPHHIPAIFHMEGLCGPLFQGTTSFPAGISRASGWNPELEQEIGRIVGRQEKAMGITHTLAPVLDVARDPRMGRQGETYGEDPSLCAAMGAAFTAGVQSGEVDGRHTDAIAKHFLGFHQSAAGIHGAYVDLPSRPLREIFAKPFQAAVTESGLKGVMPCYCTINGEPVHGSKKLLTGLLRDEIGFDGVVLSDYCGISNIYDVQHAAESRVQAGAKALEAGVDIEAHVANCYNRELVDYIQDGGMDESLLDRAVLRVLTAKFRMGLFEHPFALTGDELKAQLDQPQDQKVSLQSARESLILLKNDGVLPLSKNIRKIAVLGEQAANARIFFGGYTHLSMAEAVYAAGASMAGVEPKPWQTGVYTPIPGTPIQPDHEECFDAILIRQKPACRNLLEQLQYDLPDVEIVYASGYPIAGNDCSRHDEAVEVCRGADVVLMVLGGKHGSGSIASMGEGVDAVDIGLPECQERMILRLKELGIPMVGIHFNGRPISSDVADENLNAILECWSPSEAGAQAIVETLRGICNPCGKLPVTVARCAGQLPIFYNHPYGSSWHQGESIGFANYVDMSHKPRYPFGFGMSYTTFCYSQLQLSKKQLTEDDILEIRFQVRNTGNVSGTEVVQLYVSDLYASVCRPVQELAGFARVQLQSGEEKTVQFQLQLSQLAFLDEEMRWKVEHGEVAVGVGASSEDIRLKDTVTIMDDVWIEGKKRGFWAKAVIR